MVSILNRAQNVNDIVWSDRSVSLWDIAAAFVSKLLGIEAWQNLLHDPQTPLRDVPPYVR